MDRQLNADDTRHKLAAFWAALRGVALGIAGLALAACGEDIADLRVAGLVERDRIELVAEANEPVVEIAVREGQSVRAGDMILRLDDRVLAAQLAQARAARDREAGRLDELVRGPRIERIDAARARLNGAEDALVEAERDFERADQLLKERTVSRAFFDAAQTRLSEARARRDEIKAQLTELLQGTTEEELAQARAALTEAEAAVIAAETRVDRLTVRAPVVGTVDALPFEVGERPQTGAVVAVMLAAGTPYVRVYLPAELKPVVQSGTRAMIYLDGSDETYDARVRYVATDAAFTPYFALTEHDRSRLSYLAEVDLVGAGAGDLPTGLPVTVGFVPGATDGAGDPDADLVSDLR